MHEPQPNLRDFASFCYITLCSKILLLVLIIILQIKYRNNKIILVHIITESLEMNKGKCNKMSSLFVCFKAIVDANDDFKPTRRKRNPSSDPVLAYMATADKDGVVLFSSTSKEESSRRRKRARKTWYALKMAINDTPLVVFFLFFLSIFLISNMIFEHLLILCTYSTPQFLSISFFLSHH